MRGVVMRAAVAAAMSLTLAVTAMDGGIGDYRPRPDGRQIAFVGGLNGHPARSYSQPDLFVTETTPGVGVNFS